MKTFKRTPINVLKNVSYTIMTPLVMGVIVYFGLYTFTQLDTNMLTMISGGIAGLIFIYMLYLLFVNDAVKIEVSESELRYYQKNKLKDIYSFDQYSFGYHSVRTGSTTDTIDLQVVNKKTGNETVLNCEPLGPSQFHKLFALIEGYQQYNNSENVVVLKESV